MKLIRNGLIFLMTAAILLSLCACGNGQKKGDGTTADYQVKVLNGEGSPITEGVIVRFLSNGEQIAMQPVNSEGVAAKTLDKNDYTVELTFTDSQLEGYYDKDAAVLSVDKTAIELTLVKKLTGEPQALFAGGEEHAAYPVNAGSTYVTVKASVRNYFLFTPTEAGTYKFAVNDSKIKLGYYGSPFFVQEASAIDVVDNTVTISVSESAIGGTSVIGLDGVDADGDYILNIIRTGDPSVTIADMPWTEYKTTHTPAPYSLTLSGNQKLVYVDTKGKTEDNKIVFNEADGYYHYRTADGPVLLMHLGQKAPFFSLQTIIEGDGLGGGAPIREYFYDANGNFVKKEDYTEILHTYFQNMDKTAGVYPLTDDLIYIVKNGCKQWWDKDDPDYNADYSITDCNPEIGWMFALCYVQG